MKFELEIEFETSFRLCRQTVSIVSVVNLDILAYMSNKSGECSSRLLNWIATQRFANRPIDGHPHDFETEYRPLERISCCII